MTIPHRHTYFLALLLVPLLSCLAHADSPQPAAADIARADADYVLQGEFSGEISTKQPKSRRLALQIKALGNGTFEAAQYSGGLPGTRPRSQSTVRLMGKRNAEFLVLSGGPWAVFVRPDHCLLIDPNGNQVGRLDRVQRKSPTLGVEPPKNAVVLFDGSDTDQFDNARMTDDGLLMEGADLRPMFQDFNLHIEFMLPYMPKAAGQNRANSGVYLQSRYELQILDSFAMEPRNNGCGGLYTFRQPDVNMCFPPLTWQTYDIKFTAPRWASDGKKIKNARITIWHNGVKIHKKVELPHPTGRGKPEEPTLLPITFQNHGNPVRFRNIWIVDRGATRPGKFPLRNKAAN